MISTGIEYRSMCFSWGMLALLVSLPTVSNGQTSDHAPWLAGELFAESDIIESNGLAIRHHAAKLSPPERYEYLLHWVLPDEGRSPARLGIGFTQTDPVPNAHAVVSGDATQARRIHVGGEVVSPALDLIRTAAELGKLKTLQERIAATEATSTTDERCRTALLVAISAKQNAADDVSRHIEELLLDGAPSAPIDGRLSPWLLFSLHCLLDSSLADRQTILELPHLLKRVKSSGARNVATRHLKATINRLIAAGESGDGQSLVDTQWTSRQWQPVNRFNAESRGTGVNPSLWKLRSGQAQNIASHGHDLLYFAVPMQRDFEVESDVSAFGGRDVELQVAGRWYAPSFTLDKYSSGNIRGARKYHKLPTKMSKVVDSVWSRSRVRDGRLSTSFNGRTIDSVAVPDDHDPWVAIHSEQHYEGWARNVHIAGEPTIPESLQLATDGKQSGWVTYYGSTIGGAGTQWKPASNPKLVRLLGTRRPDLEGCHYEELIYYHRPMLEDGSMEVEFFYRENEMMVHPAMDRMCFLLQPDGVKLHWLTDAAFDRSERTPNNTIDESDCRRGPAKLPLNGESWNTLGLDLADDTMTLTLNGVEVYERELPATNQRTFGMFHFADQTEARVRSVVYRGDWARQIPNRVQQELANPVQRELEKHLAALPAKFEYDFSNGLPKQAFYSPGIESEDYVNAVDDGVHINRPGVDDDRWYDSILVPNCELHGDFDIEIHFKDFKATYSPGGYGSVGIRISFDDKFSTWCTWTRRTEPTKTGSEHNSMRLMTSQRRQGKTFHEHFEGGSAEFSSGTLRIARKGEILYFMIAEHDSSFFRILKTFPVSRAPILPTGIRFLTSSYQAGNTDVNWQTLRLCADKITGLAIKESVPDVTALNEQRDALPLFLDVNFGNNTEVENAFLPLPRLGTFTYENGGLRVVSPGANEWAATGLTAKEPLTGDFDVALSFDDVQFERPPLDYTSTVYLSLEFEGPDRPAIHCKFAIDADGNLAAATQRRFRRQDGTFTYRKQSVQKVDSMHSLRVARRDDIAYLLFRRRPHEPWELLELIPVGTQNVRPQGLQVKVHTGGEGKVSKVLLKRLTVNARKPPLGPLGILRALLE